MKNKAYNTPLRILDGQKVYYLDDMPRPVREAIRVFIGVHNPFDDECYATFEQYHEWMKTL